MYLAGLVEVGMGEGLQRLDVGLHVDGLLEGAVGAVEEDGLEDHEGLEDDDGLLVGAKYGLPDGRGWLMAGVVDGRGG